MLISTRILRYLAMVLAVAGMISIAACAKKPKPEESNVPTAVGGDESVMGDSDQAKAMGMETIHFPYDSFTMDEAAKTILKANFEIMKAKPTVKIQIEGHCDQHGGIQYNIALGEKRANAVKNYLVDLGVVADRITTISFGKERPIDPATTDEARAKNRRANFVITSR